MAELEKKLFRGIRQVSKKTFDSTQVKEGYLWLVKDGKNRTIYFGNQEYANLDSDATEKEIQEKIDAAFEKFVKQDLLHSFDADGKLKNEITLAIQKNESGASILHLKGKDDTDVATIDMSQFVVDGMVNNVTYDKDTHSLIISFNTDAGKKDILVDLSDLVDIYIAGNGIVIDENNAISLKIADDSQDFLSIDENGIKLSNVDGAHIHLGAVITDDKAQEIEQTTELTNVLQTIFDTIKEIKTEALSVEGDGMSIDITDDHETSTKKIASLKTEKLSEQTINEGHIQIVSDSTDGVYGTMYYMTNIESITGEIADGTINGESVSLYDATVSNDNRLKIVATDDIEIEDVTLSGEFPKTTGNAIVSINGGTSLVINNMTYDDTVTGYNALEIGLNSEDKYKNIDITNCNFNGVCSNNAILIFGTDDNAIINIKNCHFHQVSNCLRLSNKFNAQNVVVNITDCSVDQWDTNPNWEGFLICEDYTSKSVDAEQANNLFGDGKITVNFTNLTLKGEKIMGETPNRVTYVYNDYGNLVTDENYLPKVTFN